MKDNYVDVKNTKWWIKFLLLFKKKHSRYERYSRYLSFITYKKLFGRIYIIDDCLFGFDLYWGDDKEWN